MKKKYIDRVLTPSVVEQQLNIQLQAGFKRVRDELGQKSDHDLAELLGWPATYRHWLTLKRLMPLERACELAAAGGCHLDELIRASGAEARR